MARGLTWLETLFVLLLIGILLGASLPAWHTFLWQTQDRILQNQLLELIKYAQLSADLSQRTIGICQSQDQQTCSGNWEHGQIVFSDDHQDGLLHDKTQILRIANLRLTHGSLKWRAYPSYRQTWLFHPSDTLTTDNATLWHCHDHTPNWAIIVNQSGEARILNADMADLKLNC